MTKEFRVEGKVDAVLVLVEDRRDLSFRGVIGGVSGERNTSSNALVLLGFVSSPVSVR